MKIYVDELPANPQEDCLFFNPLGKHSCTFGCSCLTSCPLTPLPSPSFSDKKTKPNASDIKKKVIIYTDGSCLNNPGPGGWGAILIYDGAELCELSGGETQTTNNRMELMGVIKGLSELHEPCIVDLYSDSQYVINGLEKGWAAGWKKRGWVKSDKTPALNPELWDKLLTLTEKHEMHYHWVKGHADNEYNNRCDKLAVAESRKASKAR